MKRWICVLLLIVSLLSLTACSAQEVSDTMLDLAQELEQESSQQPEAWEEDWEIWEPEENIEILYPEEETGTSASIEEDGVYTQKDDVALYIYTYGCLPDNFITKTEARELGWSGGGLDAYAEGMCIGGDYFGNYEGLLPEEEGRSYTECDINTLGEDSRGAERIVFSNDGLIYYTEDHYESFELLYGTP